MYMYVYFKSGEVVKTSCTCMSISHREKLLRLEHENKMLKLRDTGDNEEQSQVLQTLLDDANLRKNELETELR